MLKTIQLHQSREFRGTFHIHRFDLIADTKNLKRIDCNCHYVLKKKRFRETIQQKSQWETGINIYTILNAKHMIENKVKMISHYCKYLQISFLHLNNFLNISR